MQAAEILKNLPDLTRITRYCEAEEIGTFYLSIRKLLQEDLQQLRSWENESQILLKQVRTADAPLLRKIHQRLNQIEQDRFLLTNSVPALHFNCTHYRDVIATRAVEIVEEEMAAAGKAIPDSPYA